MTGWYRVRTAAVVVVALAAGLAASAAPAGADAPEGAAPVTETFSYTGGVQIYEVPQGICAVTVEAIGAAGGSFATVVGNGSGGGEGGMATTELEVTAGETLEVRVGGEPVGGAGGFNGGGSSTTSFAGFGRAGAGGGASDVRRGGSALADRVVVAGGGGGEGVAGTLDAVLGDRGGDGGGVTGGDGAGLGGGGGGPETGGVSHPTGGPSGAGSGADAAGTIFPPVSGAGGGAGGGGWFGGGAGGYSLLAAGGGGGGSGHGPLGTVFGTSTAPASVSITADPAAPGCPRVRADHRMLSSRASSAAPGAAFVHSGPGVNTFAREPVAGPPRSVVRFPVGNGLDLDATSIHRDRYTIVVLFRLDEVGDWRRVVNIADDREEGLYVNDGILTFFGLGAGAEPTIDPAEWVQVALTRTQAGRLRGFVDGVEQFDVSDPAGLGVISEAEVVRLFQDDGGDDEESSGAVARVRLWDGALSPTQVAALDELPPAARLARDRPAAAQLGRFRVTGTGFGPGEQVRLSLRDRTGRVRVLGTARATRTGAITKLVQVPPVMADGPARITSLGLTSGLAPGVSFRIT